jgi:hypothetical protein
MTKVKVDFIAKAHAAWGSALPDWVEALAQEANRGTSAKAAQRIGYTGAVVSHVFSKNYPGDIARVEAKVRGALMSATVVCPVVGEIGLDRCLNEQKMGNTGASPIRARIFRKCRGIGAAKCPHSRIKMEGDDA